MKNLFFQKEKLRHLQSQTDIFGIAQTIVYGNTLFPSSGGDHFHHHPSWEELTRRQKAREATPIQTGWDFVRQNSENTEQTSI